MNLIDTQAAAVLAGCAPATIRGWAMAGLLHRQGTDRHRRALYDPLEVQEVAEQRRPVVKLRRAA